MSPNRFVGTWKLISCNARRRNGQVMPLYGPDPEGRLFYDAAGNMSVHIMQAGRPCFSQNQKFRATEQEMRAAYQGYEAYFSTYEIDCEKSVVKHSVQGGLFPNWTGSVQSRYFRFEGDDRLVLSTEPVDAAPSRSTIVTLTWERMS
jgi:lipocalin-like protein